MVKHVLETTFFAHPECASSAKYYARSLEDLNRNEAVENAALLYLYCYRLKELRSLEKGTRSNLEAYMMENYEGLTKEDATALLELTVDLLPIFPQTEKAAKETPAVSPKKGVVPLPERKAPAVGEEELGAALPLQKGLFPEEEKKAEAVPDAPRKAPEASPLAPEKEAGFAEKKQNIPSKSHSKLTIRQKRQILLYSLIGTVLVVLFIVALVFALK
jgi:hypothetical protein